ncbi:MAG: non-heme iron oxygenase ferredoxin subunit [Actinobacteria bacterium]|jgi:3-phenylpropionate/trans-cinnamate dioxygenase ferredoxin subunit|nr:non-heme iron oxygenase ferredoxin subunit [Actinomycetota bacterium]NDH12696.1 non-heme iron oxygenase ferredoxin subunit [Actinomycetota bacterium]TRZ86600.1 MAG: non-heme iron oxygenase ferredoxin subunit [Streptomycetaceae bacterium]
MSKVTFTIGELTPGKPRKMEVGGEDVCVTRIGDEVFAIGDVCTHSEASLSEGDVSDYKIECWLHGAEFDLRNGKSLTPPATEDAKVFAVTRDGDTVTISHN